MGLLDKWRRRPERQPDPPPSVQAVGASPPEQGDARAMYIDPWELAQHQAWMEQVQVKSVWSNRILWDMSQLPWVSPIIRNRVGKAAKIAKRQRGPHDVGYGIRLRESKKSPSRAAEKKIEELSNLIDHCGFVDEDDHVTRLQRDSFPTFAKKVVRDSSIYEALAFEIVPDRRGKPAWWRAVDGATIFRVRPKGPYGYYQADDAAWVQIINAQPQAYFSIEEMAYGVRYPSTHLENAGYGSPELVELLAVLSNIMYAYAYNQKFFQQGGPPGVLAVLGEMPEDKFKAFSRQVRFMLSGLRNAHTLPMVNPQGAGSDMKWIPFSGYTHQEMEFSQWLLTNQKLAAAVFQINLEEIGIYTGNEGVRSSLSEGGIEDKVRISSDKGFDAIRDVLTETMNRHIIFPLAPDFEFGIYGVGGLSPKEQAELAEKRGRSHIMVDELRAEDGLKPLPDDKGQVLLNDVWLRHVQGMQETAAAQAQAGQQPGGPGGDGGPGGAPQGERVPATPGTDPLDDWGPEDGAGGPAGGQGSGGRAGGQGAPGDEAAKSLRTPGGRRGHGGHGGRVFTIEV